MKRICTILLLVGLFMGQAWGQDCPPGEKCRYRADSWANSVGTDFIDNRGDETIVIYDWKSNCEDGDWNIGVGENGPAIYYCENDEWVYQGDILYADPKKTSGLTALSPEVTTDEINAILVRCLRIIPYDIFLTSDSEKELRQLRSDIEAMLKWLTNGSNGSLEKEG